MTPERTAQAILAQVPLTQFFESAEQTITAGGQLVIAHGLSAKPVLFSAVLVCKTAEMNYSVDDETPVPLATTYDGSVASNGIQFVPDATNLTVRYGSSTGVFSILNKTTGARAAITPANWRLVLRAWA